MEQTVRGKIHSVESFGAVDGPGVRYVVFLQGCPLRCQYCHNPDTWSIADGKETDSATQAKEIATYRNFIKNGGVTLSGGEPLMQPEFSLDIIRRCRQEGFHTALDTAGSVPLKTAQPVVEAADLILLDLKALDAALCQELTGRDNANALALLNFCEATNKPVWIRHVMVPGVTLSESRLRELADFLTKYRCIQKIELLPFHQMGRYKWDALQLEYKLKDTPEPDKDELLMAKSIFQARNLPL